MGGREVSRARCFARDHWRKAAAGLFVLAVVWLWWSLHLEQARNTSQDEIDRYRTEQVADILNQLSDIVERQDSDRLASSVESCERGNEIRRSILRLSERLTDDPEVLELVAAEIGVVDCTAAAQFPSPSASVPTTSLPRRP